MTRILHKSFILMLLLLISAIFFTTGKAWSACSGADMSGISSCLYTGGLGTVGGKTDGIAADLAHSNMYPFGYVVQPACADADGDGYGSPGSPLCLNGSSTDCDDSDPDIHPDALDANCNNADEDCSGLADDGYVPTGTTCGTGACASAGQMLCQNGVEIDTCAAGSPTGDDSDCDGVDDDCDGQADENFVSTASMCGIGDCSSTGLNVCQAGELVSTCIPGQPGTETCDGHDNDCDGAVDEGYDADGDGVVDCIDNCPTVANPSQADDDGNGTGNICEVPEFVWKSPGQPSFDGPYGVATDASGNIFVADSYSHRIQKIDSSGNFLTMWGTNGTGAGKFDYPFGVAVDSSGNVYVADLFNHRIQKFSNNGGYISEWGVYGNGSGEFKYPIGVAVDGSGNVYVLDNGNSRVQKFNSNGTFILKWGTNGSGNGEFDTPYGIAVSSDGYVYVTDTWNHRIQKFDGSGVFVRTWGSFGSGDGQLMYPIGIAVDSAGNVYVADTDNDRIQKFDSDGNFIIQWGTYGSGDGEFISPSGVAVDRAGNIYVADYWNSRVQKFGFSDTDNDGFGVNVDCDDDDLSIYPGASDIACNGIDDNCNGVVDDGYVSTATACGTGACAASGMLSCENGVEVNSCTSGEPESEICDNIDNDCDGIVDDNIAAMPSTCGTGACASTGEIICANGTPQDTCVVGQPTGDDNDCNGTDDDCDGTADEGYASTPTTCGIGACESTGQLVCTGGVIQDTCTAGTPQVEVCNNADDDCNGNVDEGLAIASWYYDYDGDTYGNPAVWQDACSQPSVGWVTDNSDCDDSDQYIYPGGPEVRIIDPPTSYYWISELQTAYNDAVDQETIQGKAATYTGNLLINNDKTVMIEGGYSGTNNCGFSSITGKTTVSGNVMVSDGTLKILNGTLEVE